MSFEILGLDAYRDALVDEHYDAFEDEDPSTPSNYVELDEMEAVMASDNIYDEYRVSVPEWMINDLNKVGVLDDVIALYQARADTYSREEREKLLFFLEEYIGPFTVMPWVQTPPKKEEPEWDNLGDLDKHPF